MDLLNVSGIGKKERGEYILKDISFTLRASRKIAIAGETGSGKSTLLKIIAGLIQADDGQVLFNNKKVDGPDEKLIPGHPAIAYLSQHFELRNNYRVEEILSYANLLSTADAENLFRLCRIDHLLARRTDQISGGEKQRIALTRLLISSPKLLLLDEPYSNLDLIQKNILKKVINDLSEQLEITCMLVSHDPQDILSWADEILIMKDGQIIQKDNPEQVYRYPVNEYAAGLLGKYNVLTSAMAEIFSIPFDKNIPAFLRPEAFRVASGSTKGAPGTVIGVIYYGSFYELDIEVENTRITTVSELNGFAPGDAVYLYWFRG